MLNSAIAGEFPSNELPDDACKQGNSRYYPGLQTGMDVKEVDESSSCHTPDVEKEKRNMDTI